MPIAKLKIALKAKTFISLSMIMILLISSLWLRLPVQAQEGGVPQAGNGMQISPAVREYTLDPGESVGYELRLTNITDNPITAESVITDFEQKEGEEGIPKLILDDSENPYSIKRFVSDFGSVTLAPKEQKVLDVSITVPRDASPGAHFGAIRFVTSSESTEGSTVVSLAAGVGALIFINVTGDINDNLTLLQLSAAKEGKTGTIFDNGSLSIVTRVQNKGNTYLKPFGRLVIKDWKNRVVEEKDFNAETPKLVLPGTVRRLEDRLDQNKRYFGRYKAEVQMAYGEGGGDIIIGNVTFWVLPWRQVLISIAALAVLAFLIYRGLISYKRRILNMENRRRR